LAVKTGHTRLPKRRRQGRDDRSKGQFWNTRIVVDWQEKEKKRTRGLFLDAVLYRIMAFTLLAACGVSSSGFGVESEGRERRI
jgi:hypothetical protein